MLPMEHPDDGKILLQAWARVSFRYENALSTRYLRGPLVRLRDAVDVSLTRHSRALAELNIPGLLDAITVNEGLF